MALTADQVQKFYIGYYARPADPVGLTYWQTQDEAAALKGFSESAEFTSQFTGLSASQQVTKVYNNLLGRAPDTAGLLYWAGELTAGRETIGTLVLSMIKNALGKDVTTIEDRVTYSKSFTAALDTAAEINAYAGAAATQTARTALLKVVANSVGDHTALNAEVKNIDTTVATIVSGGSGGGTPGQAFTLTTVVGENIVGTAGNDTFSAVVGTGGTLNIGDQIDGAAGTDTLNLIIADGATAIPAGASTKNIEIVKLNYVGAAAADIIGTPVTAANFAGVQQLWQVDNVAGANATFQNVTVAADVTAGFASNNAVATAVAATAAVAAASGTQATLNVALDGIGHNTALTFNGAGVKTINVSGTVAAQTATNAGDLALIQGTSTAETIKLSLTSAADLLTLASFTTLKTLDASASTGAIRADGTNGVAIANATLNQLTSVKLGSANDSVAFTLGGTKALTIDAGAGNDTITLGGTAAADNLVSVTLGAGKDTIVVGSTLANLAAGVDTDANLTARITTISDFNKAEDVINLGGTGVALTSSQLESIKGAATLVAATTAASALAGGVGGQVVFSWGSDAYVYTDTAVLGLTTNDSLVKIVGLNAADLSNAQNGNLVL